MQIEENARNGIKVYMEALWRVLQYLTKIGDKRVSPDLFEQRAKTKVFSEAQSRPATQKKIERNGEENRPGRVEKECSECRNLRYGTDDTGDKEGLCGEEKGDFGVFFRLGGDEFLGENNHDDEGNDGNSGKSGALRGGAEQEEKKESRGNKSERDCNAGKRKKAKFFKEKARSPSDSNNGKIESDAVFESDGDERKGDECWRVDTKCFDADYLAKKGDKCENDGEEKEKAKCFDRHTLFKGKLNERMKRHRKEK